MFQLSGFDFMCYLPGLMINKNISCILVLMAAKDKVDGREHAES